MQGILLALLYIALLIAIMRRMRFFNSVEALKWQHIAGIFVLKVAAGTLLWAIYTVIYPDRLTADIFKFYDDSAVMFSALPGRPRDYLQMLFGIQNDTPYFTEEYYRKMNNWFRQYESEVHNDAHTVIRFNALVRLISFGEFHVHTVIAAFLSTTGMVAIYRTFVKKLPGRERLLMIAIFLLPSVLFWASGVIKESLLFFGLGILIHQVFRSIEKRNNAAGLIALFFSVILLFYLKIYVLLSLVPALLLWAWSRNGTSIAIAWKAVVIYGSGIVLALSIHHLIPGFDVIGLIALKQKDFIGLATSVDSGSFVQPPLITPDPLSLLINAPYAIYITLIGPLIHFTGTFGAIAALENFLIISAFVFLLVYAKPWRSVDRPLVISLIGYCVLLALVIGWTTPVMGAIVRYRTPLLPFLLIIALLLFDHQRFIRQWPSLKRFISA